MTLEEILDDWDKDSVIDRTDVGGDALENSRLQAKWLRRLSYERLRLKQIEGESKRLRLDKHEFYTLGPTKETHERGWVPPAVGRILNKDLDTYMQADSEVIKMNLRVALQAEIVAALELIMKEIMGRNWHQGRAIEWAKLQAGN